MNLRVRPEVLRMLLISTNRYLDFIELYQYHTYTHTRPRVDAREKIREIEDQFIAKVSHVFFFNSADFSPKSFRFLLLLYRLNFFT